jgi:hypothetical protein
VQSSGEAARPSNCWAKPSCFVFQLAMARL